MSDSSEKVSIEDIENKYLEFGKKDPYPEIAPALLNSADIYDYVEKTGMIYPFYKENLKPASYGIKLKGEYVFWESTEKKISGRIENLTEKDEDGDIVLILKRNTIAYVQLEPVFRFPSYIAGRFNLKIKHIYQGILLGTGPLVDPGYEGNIYAPLHNLTNNNYKIKIDKPFIWMEFTKLSINEEWDKDYARAEGRKGEYIYFDKSRLNAKKTLSEYINDAFPNAPILSTISGFFEDTNRTLKGFENRIEINERNVQRTTDNANRATTQFNRAILVSIIAIFITAFFTIYQTVTIHNKTIDYLKEYDKRQVDEHSKFINEQSGVINLRKELDVLYKKIEDQQNQIDKLRK